MVATTVLKKKKKKTNAAFDGVAGYVKDLWFKEKL